MVDLPMLCLIGPDDHQDILHNRIWLEVEVLDRNVRRTKIWPLWDSPVIKIGNGTSVGDNSFFLNVPDEAVAGAWGDEVGKEESVEKNTLAAEDHHAHEPARLAEMEEGKKVETLIVGFFEERLNPSLVSLKAADGVKVTDHTSDHTGDTWRCLLVSV